MNMRSLTVILGALTSFALGACTVTSTTSGSGGSTSATGTGGEASGVGGSGSGGSTSTSTGTGGAAACDMKYTCAEALDGDPTKLCDGPSGDLYDAYYDCTCVTGGACFTVCSDNACTNGAKSADCTACLQKTDMGCATVLEACQGDI